jgi:hypothetical protein
MALLLPRCRRSGRPGPPSAAGGCPDRAPPGPPLRPAGADEEPHRRVRLVSCASSSFSRPLDARYAPLALRWAWGGPQVGFADGFPLLLISTASLEALNGSLSAMAEPMPMGRFRPNIVAAGCVPFEAGRAGGGARGGGGRAG